MTDAHASRTCRLCSGAHIQHVISVGVGNVRMILRVIFVMVGLSSNGNIIIVNALMLNKINLLHAMLVTPLRQLPTPLCLRPPRGPYLPCLLPFPFPLLRRDRGKGARLLVLVTLIVKILMNHVCLPLPPCPRRGMERGGGTPLRSVMGNGRLPPLPSLRRGGGRSPPGPNRTPWTRS